MAARLGGRLLRLPPLRRQRPDLLLRLIGKLVRVLFGGAGHRLGEQPCTEEVDGHGAKSAISRGDLTAPPRPVSVRGLPQSVARPIWLELFVVRAQDVDPDVQKLALESMRKEIRSATSSMTSVPKPLKFLCPHFGTLKSYFETMPESELKKYMVDILSVLALTMSIEGERESLKYRLLGSEGDIGSWGHEYGLDVQ